MQLLKTETHTGNSRFIRQSDAALYLMTADPKNGETAFRELYARLSGPLYAYCRCLSGRNIECDDLFEVTFAQLYESAKQKRSLSKVSVYVFKSARELCLYSSHGKRKTTDVECFDVRTEETSHEKPEICDLIQMAMELLSVDYREAYFLREFANLSYEDIAEIMADSASDIRIHVSRARERIRGILGPYIAVSENDL